MLYGYWYYFWRLIRKWIDFQIVQWRLKRQNPRKISGKNILVESSVRGKTQFFFAAIFNLWLVLRVVCGIIMLFSVKFGRCCYKCVFHLECKEWLRLCVWRAFQNSSIWIVGYAVKYDVMNFRMEVHDTMFWYFEVFIYLNPCIEPTVPTFHAISRSHNAFSRFCNILMYNQLMG